ncbi:threonine/serine dehydratase [SAR202 cluster bacterium AC-409-J13_OGT_754m]|nr:threonine/serine dehydratase [SAR202 cluster bacterium AC-409-J13_OGT_754m]
MEKPTFQSAVEARKTISKYVTKTPLISYAALSKYLGAEVRLKHENYHPLGSFKIRGGINLLANMSSEDIRRGLITASTGNHGQSIASASSVFGAKAIVVVPNDANPLKVDSMRNLGAEVVFYGSNFDEARGHCERLALEEGYRYVHSGNEPLIIAGVATYALEIIEDFPDVEYIFVPCGGGSGVAGVCLVVNAANSAIQVVAVQSKQAPAAYLSWKNRKLMSAPMNTIAEGLATKSGFEVPQSIMWDLLDQFLLVSDEEIELAMTVLIEKAHTLSEAAGAAALAGALQAKDSIKGNKVVIVVSGSNVTLDRLSDAIGRSKSLS